MFVGCGVNREHSGGVKMGLAVRWQQVGEGRAMTLAVTNFNTVIVIIFRII